MGDMNDIMHVSEKSGPGRPDVRNKGLVDLMLDALMHFVIM
jgi:hypothetical protein